MHWKYQKSAQDRHSLSTALHTSTVNLTSYKVNAPKTLESHVCFKFLQSSNVGFTTSTHFSKIPQENFGRTSLPSYSSMDFFSVGFSDENRLNQVLQYRRALCGMLHQLLWNQNYSLHLVLGNVLRPSYLTVCNSDPEPEQMIVN